MLAVAWQHVRREPVRFAALVAAVALPVLLVLVTSSVYLGLLDAMVAFPRSLPGDLVVTEAGASPIFMRSTSRIPRDAVERVRTVPGVADVQPLTGRLVWVERDGQRGLVFLVGIDPDATFAVPPAIRAGDARPDALDEIVVDRVLAAEMHLALRSPFRVAGARFRVAGIADGGNSVIGTFAWVNRNALVWSGTSDPSHLFVTVAPGADAAAVARRVARIRGLDVYDRDAFVTGNQAMARQYFRPVVVTIAGVTALIGSLVLALVLWMATIERREEHALLRALGFSRRRVQAIVLWQAAMVTGAGVVLGVGAGLAAATALERAIPRFTTVIPWWLAAMAAGAAAAIGLLAIWLPVRSITRTDPALVFRA